MRPVPIIIPPNRCMWSSNRCFHQVGRASIMWWPPKHARHGSAAFAPLNLHDQFIYSGNYATAIKHAWRTLWFVHLSYRGRWPNAWGVHLAIGLSIVESRDGHAPSHGLSGPKLAIFLSPSNIVSIRSRVRTTESYSWAVHELRQAFTA